MVIMVKFNKKCINSGCSRKFFVCKNKKMQCGEHQCIVSSCCTMVKKSSSSDRCVNHEKTILCSSNINDGCNTIPMINFNLCISHKCYQKDCCNHKLGISDFCKEHTCKMEMCRNSTSMKNDFCNIHRCPYKKCSKNHNCSTHTCIEKNCHNLKSEGGLCIAHKCILKGCINLSLYGEQYCKIHTCGVEDCFSYKDTEFFCKKHTCLVDGCNYKAELENSGCSTHKCIRYSCKNLRTPSGWCIEHNCSINGCQSHTDGYSGDRCYVHNCFYRPWYEFKGSWGDKCKKKPINMKEESDPKKWTCEDHACKVEGCRKGCTYFQENPREFLGGFSLSRYCNNHSCELCIKTYSWRDGINMITEGSKYCKKHTCLEENCFNKVAHQHIIQFGQRAYHSDKFYTRCPEHITKDD